MGALKALTLLLSAFAATVIAVPVVNNLPITSRDTSDVSMAFDHGPPYCTPTGPDVCNFAFYERGSHKEVWAYSYTCRQLGGTLNAVPTGWKEIRVDLPYVIAYNFPQKSIVYQGRQFSNCYRYRDTNGAPLPPADITQCAFDCATLGWHPPRGLKEITSADENIETVDAHADDVLVSGVAETHDNSSDSVVHDNTTESDSTELQTPGNAPNHGPPYCKSQGQGFCNLAFYSRPMNPDNLFNQEMRYEAFIYNRFCAEVGSIRPRHPGHGFENIYSELPYVVVLVSSNTFNYAGVRYGGPTCATYADTNSVPPYGPAHITQCAFKCGEGHWQHPITKRSIDAPINETPSAEFDSKVTTSPESETNVDATSSTVFIPAI